MFGSGDGVTEGRIHDDDATRGRRLGIDVVDANTGTPDDLEIVRCRQQLFGDLGRRADGQAIIAADDLLQFVLRQAGLHVGFDAAVLEDGDGGRR